MPTQLIRAIFIKVMYICL